MRPQSGNNTPGHAGYLPPGEKATDMDGLVRYSSHEPERKEHLKVAKMRILCEM
jgi:hypothetical protein